MLACVTKKRNNPMNPSRGYEEFLKYSESCNDCEKLIPFNQLISESTVCLDTHLLRTCDVYGNVIHIEKDNLTLCSEHVRRENNINIISDSRDQLNLWQFDPNQAHNKSF